MLPWCHLSVLIGWEDKNISRLRDDEERKTSQKWFHLERSSKKDNQTARALGSLVYEYAALSQVQMLYSCNPEVPNVVPVNSNEETAQTHSP